MISIVLPVYNGERFLKESIESILAQSYRNFELIIVNDCSTDNTSSIIEEYQRQDSRIKIIHNESNQKLPKSLNIGFANAIGKYFTWTSDDNIMLPDALEELLHCLECKNADLAFSRCFFIDAKGDTFGKTPIYKDLDEIYYNNIINASFLYKKEVHEELKGYDPDKILIEDYDFWIRAYRRFSFTFCPKLLYKIRWHENNLGVLQKEKVRLSKINLLKDNLHYLKEPQHVDKIMLEISRSYFDVSDTYYKTIIGKRWKRKLIFYHAKELIKKVIRNLLNK